MFPVTAHSSLFYPSKDSYRVLVLLRRSGGGTGSMCPMEDLEQEDEAKGHCCSQTVLGRAMIDRSTRWAQLNATLSNMFISHLQILCGESQTAGEEAQHSLLGLTPDSISSIRIGKTNQCFVNWLLFPITFFFILSDIFHFYFSLPLVVFS